MKLLKIANKGGLFLDQQGGYTTVDKITKEDLLRLATLALVDEVEFDEYADESIANQAHQIIYKSVLEKLKGLGARRQEFVDQSERLYLQEYEKYRDTPSA